MAKIHKYGVREFERDFPNEEACLKLIFETLHTYKCSCGGRYSPLKGRKQYQCSKCRFQIAPAANTIFHKSATPLKMWFLAILHFSNAKSGYSAKQLERDLNVTYKTAWRILRLIRRSLGQRNNPLKGIVEIDETYFGGKKKAGRNNELLSQAMKAKSVIAGAVERKGDILAKVAPNSKAKTLGKFLWDNVSPEETRLMTDDSTRYWKIASPYVRESVNHSRGEYVRGEAHINSIESFWSHIKRSIKGVHKSVSKQYLQKYVDGFVFHRNNRHNDRVRFHALFGMILRASR